jgi:hypothetical protein
LKAHPGARIAEKNKTLEEKGKKTFNPKQISQKKFEVLSLSLSSPQFPSKRFFPTSKFVDD